MSSTHLHILIAEDELSHAVILRRRLEKEYPDARIEVVASIREYQNSIASATPTIALVDLNLTDGCTLDMLKSSAAPPPFPLIMLSSYASSHVADEAVQAGAMAFIIKSPEVFLALAEIVEKTLHHWEQRQEKRETQ